MLERVTRKPWTPFSDLYPGSPGLDLAALLTLLATMPYAFAGLVYGAIPVVVIPTGLTVWALGARSWRSAVLRRSGALSGVIVMGFLSGFSIGFLLLPALVFGIVSVVYAVVRSRKSPLPTPNAARRRDPQPFREAS